MGEGREQDQGSPAAWSRSHSCIFRMETLLMTALWDGTLDPLWVADLIVGARGEWGLQTQVRMGQNKSAMGWCWPHLKAPGMEDALQPSTLHPVPSL